MDILKAEIERKRKELEDKDLLKPQKKYFRRGELTAKELEKYKSKYNPNPDIFTNSTEVEKGDKSDTDVKHNILPRHEVITKLRDRGEPILLFGESDTDAFKRLRKSELLEPEVNRGFRNDLQEAMEQVDQAYLNELINSKSSETEENKQNNKSQEPTVSYEEICEMAKKMGRGNREHDMITIVHFIQV